MTRNASVFFHWNIIYYILKGTLDLDFVLGLFIYWRLVFSLIGFFFSVNESILFWYCSTVLLFFIYNITHVLQMWHTQHMYYTCDSKKTCVQNFWLPVEIIVDIILFWIYFANKMCFKFYYSECFCYNETQCLHAVFALRIKEFISFLIVVCDILYIYDYHACFYVGECKCVTEIACIHLQRIWYVYAVSTITCM